MDEFDIFIKGFSAERQESPAAGLGRVFGLDSRQADDFVASLPRVVKRRVPADQIERYEQVLVELGADIERRRSPIVPAGMVVVAGAASTPRGEVEGGSTLMLELPGERPDATIGEAVAAPAARAPEPAPSDTLVDPDLPAQVEADERARRPAVSEAVQVTSAAAAGGPGVDAGDSSQTLPNYGWGDIPASRLSGARTADTFQGVSHQDEVPDLASVPPARATPSAETSVEAPAPPPGGGGAAPDAALAGITAGAAAGALDAGPPIDPLATVDDPAVLSAGAAPLARRAGRDEAPRAEPELRGAAEPRGPLPPELRARLAPVWRPLGEGDDDAFVVDDLPPPSEVPQLGPGAEDEWLMDDAAGKAAQQARVVSSASNLGGPARHDADAIPFGDDHGEPAQHAPRRIARAALIEPPAPMRPTPVRQRVELPLAGKIMIRFALGLALFSFVMIVKQCGSPVDRQLRHWEPAPEASSSSPGGRKPALEWRAGNGRVFLGFDQEVVFALIRRMKEAGAVEVYVGEIQRHNLLYVATSLEVLLPTDPAKRRGVLEIERRYSRLPEPRDLPESQSLLVVPLHE